MSTLIFSSRILHTTDAFFRAWGLELSNGFTTAGLVKASDTGQIDWSTVVRAGVNAVAGYEIWRLPDADPLYIKIEYATGTSTNIPQMFITAGSGSNGTGTLTGQLSSRLSCAINSSASDTTGVRPTFISVTPSFFGFCWKTTEFTQTTGGFARGFAFVYKSVDTSGNPTSEAMMLGARATGDSAPVFSNVRRAATAITFPNFSSSLWVPFSRGDTGGVGPYNELGNLQIYPTWIITPTVQQNWQLVAFPSYSRPALQSPQYGSPFTAVVMGSSRTYLPLSSLTGQTSAAGEGNKYSLAMVWIT